MGGHRLYAPELLPLIIKIKVLLKDGKTRASEVSPKLLEKSGVSSQYLQLYTFTFVSIGESVNLWLFSGDIRVTFGLHRVTYGSKGRVTLSFSLCCIDFLI